MTSTSYWKFYAKIAILKNEILILENNSLQRIIFLDVFLRLGKKEETNFSALAKKLRDSLKLVHSETNLHEYYYPPADKF